MSEAHRPYCRSQDMRLVLDRGELDHGTRPSEPGVSGQP